MLSLRAGLLVIGLLTALALPMMADTSVVSEFTVLVDTDKTFYQTGEAIVIDVYTLLNGVSIPAVLVNVILTVSNPNGDELRFITPAFRSIGTGRYVAQGIAQGTGLRKVDVVASYQPTNGPILTGVGYESYLVDAQVTQPGFFVDIEFKDLPVNPTVCDQIKVTLTVNRIAFVRFFQQMPDGTFRDILVPGWLKPGSRWIKFEPNRFDSGLIVFKVIAKDQHGNEVMDNLSIFLPNC